MRRMLLAVFLLPLMLACNVPVDVQDAESEGERNAQFLQNKVKELGSSFDKFYVEKSGTQIDAFDDYDFQGEYLVNTRSEITYYNLNNVLSIQVFQPEWAVGKTAIRVVLD